jgi:hypothetical protein
MSVGAVARRSIGAAVVVTAGVPVAGVTTTGAAAAAAPRISCPARASTSRPLSYTIVTIDISTKPGAKVSATVTSGKSTISLQPTAPANSSGKAWLYEKISAVTRSMVALVTVRVSSHCAIGLCRTHFTPVALSG